MTSAFANWVTLVAAIAAAIIGVILLVRGNGNGAQSGREVRDELKAAREEARGAAKDLRDEVAASLKTATDALVRIQDGHAKLQQSQMETLAERMSELNTRSDASLDTIRTTLDTRVKELQLTNTTSLTEMRELVKSLTESSQKSLESIRLTLEERLKELQEQNGKSISEMRRDAADGLRATQETLSKTLEQMSVAQRAELETMTKQVKELADSNTTGLDAIRTTFDTRVQALQEGNEKKLDEMRKTVDEKLHETLEKRLGESFKQVSDRLEAVHKGLGEMQTLATGVGDLKRVLTNVKARGTWAEVQLGALLEQVLTLEQFDKNVCVKPETLERVEFAIRLPGPKDDPKAHIWLPIDSKFPQEDYLRLQDAAEKADLVAVKSATEDLARTVRREAKDIYEKYVNPPVTTDFGILFLATEGLYAEVLRQPLLVEELQREFRVVVAGPTTLIAILSSLRMGFQTLAIEKQTSEVRHILGAVKTEFGKFGDVLDKVKKQLNTASDTIEKTTVRSRAIERKLRQVQELPAAEARSVLQLSVDPETDELDEAVEEDEAAI